MTPAHARCLAIPQVLEALERLPRPVVALWLKRMLHLPGAGSSSYARQSQAFALGLYRRCSPNAEITAGMIALGFSYHELAEMASQKQATRSAST
jgi:hypothetical protein